MGKPVPADGNLGLKKNFAWMLTNKAIAMMASIIIAALANRALGPSGRGILAEIQTWIALFTTVFGISLESAIYHFADKSRYGITDSTRFRTIALLSIGCSCCGAGALFATTQILPGQFSPTAIQNIFLASLVLFSSMFANHINIFIQATGNIRHVAIVSIIVTVFSFLLTIIAYFTDAITVPIMLVLTFLPQPVMIAGLLLPVLRKDGISGSFSVSLARGIVISGLKQHIGTISSFITIRLNQIIIFKYCGESPAGNYAVSLGAVLALMTIPMTFQQTLYPRVIHSDDDFEVSILSARYAFYFWGLITLGFAITARPLLYLYAGKDFAESPEIFRILLVMGWLNPVGALFTPYMIKLGAFYAISVINLTLCVSSLILNYTLIPQWGIMGAAVSTSTVGIVGFVICYSTFWFLVKRNPIVMFKPDFSEFFDIVRTVVKKMLKSH